MKTTILILLAVCLGFNGEAQTKSKAKTLPKPPVKTQIKTSVQAAPVTAAMPYKEFAPIGVWSIKSLDIPTVKSLEVDESSRKQLERALVGSVFTILDNHTCTLKSAFEVNEFDIKNGYWIYDPTAKKVLICDYKDRDEMKPLLLEFTVKQEGANTFFVLIEEKGTPMIRLAMQKI
jgi:hypothetical protein